MAGPRILGLRLLTAAPLAQLAAFYGETLGLPTRATEPRRLTVVAGATRLTFEAAAPGQGRPFYHLAFNIPENKTREASRWQGERTALIPPGAGEADRLRDPGYPGDVVSFRHWNAHSIFFHDPAGNLLEHIARHDLDNGAPGPFTSRDILCAGEIALIAEDVRATASALGHALDLPLYGAASDAFAALGDEDGLLLVMKRGRNLGFDAGKPAEVFPTGVHLRGPRPMRYQPPGLPHQITVA